MEAIEKIEAVLDHIQNVQRNFVDIINLYWKNCLDTEELGEGIRYIN